jgi:hypothetical protein
MPPPAPALNLLGTLLCGSSDSNRLGSDRGRVPDRSRAACASDSSRYLRLCSGDTEPGSPSSWRLCVTWRRRRSLRPCPRSEVRSSSRPSRSFALDGGFGVEAGVGDAVAFGRRLPVGRVKIGARWRAGHAHSGRDRECVDDLAGRGSVRCTCERMTCGHRHGDRPGRTHGYQDRPPSCSSRRLQGASKRSMGREAKRAAHEMWPTHPWTRPSATDPNAGAGVMNVRRRRDDRHG